MAEAHPGPGLVRKLGQDALVEGDGALIVADPAKGGGLEVSIAGMSRITVHQPLEMAQGFL